MRAPDFYNRRMHPNIHVERNTLEFILICDVYCKAGGMFNDRMRS
jgi:hypothetical protein